ncbi:MAG TPA: hypothetical protein VGE01_02705, partial [Fimbriimonas sp.]
MTIRLQCVLFEPSSAELDRLLDSLLTLDVPEGIGLEIVLGDCTPSPEIGVQPWIERFDGRLRYEAFGANLGFGAGHNRLFLPSSADHLFLLNPDCLAPHHLVDRVWAAAGRRPDWGIVEVRQIPLEHPKNFDKSTFETSWASGCCSLVNGEL